MDSTRNTKRDAAPTRVAVLPQDGEALKRRISEKAYEIFLSRGRAHGHHHEDWLQAERLVLRELRAGSTDAPKAAGSRPAPRPAPGQRRFSS